MVEVTFGSFAKVKSARKERPGALRLPKNYRILLILLGGLQRFEDLNELVDLGEFIERQPGAKGEAFLQVEPLRNSA